MLLQDMYEQDVEPDVITFTVANQACTNGGEWELALTLFDHTIERGVKLNRASFRAALTACEMGGVSASPRYQTPMMSPAMSDMDVDMGMDVGRGTWQWPGPWTYAWAWAWAWTHLC